MYVYASFIGIEHPLLEYFLLPLSYFILCGMTGVYAIQDIKLKHLFSALYQEVA